MVNIRRTAIVELLKNITTNKTAIVLREVHAKLRLSEPTIEEIIKIKNEKPERILSFVANQCVEWLLDIRTKPLKRGVLKEERDAFQKEVLFSLEQGVDLSTKSIKVVGEYKKLALSISRLIALYYVENEKQPTHVEGRLEAVLPFLAHHLLTEVELCVEAKFSDPYKNLSKISVFAIDAKLRMLETHAEEIVRDNALTIVYAALHQGNLELADRLAEGAAAKLHMLETHAEEIVRDNARTIVGAALHQGNLQLADRLAEGAAAKLHMLETHAEEIVRDNARTIVGAALHQGNLELADRLAEGAKEMFDKLRVHSDPDTRRKARTVVSNLLNAGKLQIEM